MMKQDEAIQFVDAWKNYKTLNEVSEVLGIDTETTSSMASELRSLGLNLPERLDLGELQNRLEDPEEGEEEEEEENPPKVPRVVIAKWRLGLDDYEKHFIRIWNYSDSVDEAARRFGWSEAYTRQQASKQRNARSWKHRTSKYGFEVKFMASGKTIGDILSEANPETLIRLYGETEENLKTLSEKELKVKLASYGLSAQVGGGRKKMAIKRLMIAKSYLTLEEGE